MNLHFCNVIEERTLLQKKGRICTFLLLSNWSVNGENYIRMINLVGYWELRIFASVNFINWFSTPHQHFLCECCPILRIPFDSTWKDFLWPIATKMKTKKHIGRHKQNSRFLFVVLLNKMNSYIRHTVRVLIFLNFNIAFIFRTLYLKKSVPFSSKKEK